MGKILGFDGLRAIGVMIVIMSHAAILQRNGITDPRIIRIFGPTVGVNIFFALSGFLITLLLIRERRATGTVNLKAFYVRRALRIFPLYYLSLALIFLMDIMGKIDLNACSYAATLSYTQNFATRACRPHLTSHFWSLAVEEHFYLLWPAIFLLGIRIALPAIAAFGVVCLTITPYLVEWFPGHSITRWTIPAAAPIAFGCVAAFYCDHPRVKALFTNRTNGPLVLIAIAAGLVTPAFHDSLTIWLLAVTGLILYVYHNQGSRLVRALEIQPLAAIGVMSYGLYVWQGVLAGNGTYRIPGSTFPPELDVGLWLTFIVAPLGYILFERPILKLKNRFSWRGKAQGDAHRTGPHPAPEGRHHHSAPALPSLTR